MSHTLIVSTTKACTQNKYSQSIDKLNIKQINFHSIYKYATQLSITGTNQKCGDEEQQ